MCSCKNERKNDLAIEKSKHIISGYKAVFLMPPEHVPSFKIVDGPITGNGDIGLTLSGEAQHQRYWISKNDFWKSGPHFKQCGPSLIGGIDIIIDDLEDSNYYVEQRLYESLIFSEFSHDQNKVNINARVAAGDNIIILRLEATGKAVDVKINLWPQDGYGSVTESGREGDVIWVTRKFDTDDLLYPTAATIAMKNYDPEARSFSLAPGDPVTIIASVVTNHESGTYNSDAIEKVSALSMNEVDLLIDDHQAWWASFWAESFVDIEDETLEKYYYASNYIMACCSRNVNFPPGLYGNWITMNRTAWSGDIHLDYNHEAPFWALYSSNHISLTDSYDTPLIEHLPIFIGNAREYLNKNGAYASAAIGPKGLILKFPDKAGMDTIYGNKLGSTSYESLIGQPMFAGMKSNAVFASMNMILRYRYTHDNEYAKKVYPYLVAVADFWEDYLVFENGRFVIFSDSYNEVGPWNGPGWEKGYGDFNPINSLGFLQVFFNAMIEISTELGVDSGRRDEWHNILENLSDYPVYEINGNKQFRACEGGTGAFKDLKGLKWYMIHGLVFPATNIGLGSDPSILEMVREGIDEWGDRTWLQSGNSIQTVLIGAARVGYDPVVLIKKAKEKIEKYAYPNLWIYAEGGGIETCSAIPGMINEMMLQSDNGVIRIFPVYPEEQKASFYRLRTFGAFLVSSEIDNGDIKYIIVESEKGKECNILNPWQDEEITVSRNGNVKDIPPAEILSFETDPGDKIILAPEGTSFKEIEINLFNY